MAYSLTYSYYPESQSYSVVDYSGITTTDKVVIPSTYDDRTNGTHPVTSISSGAFYNCGGLTSITIPDGVTSIGDYAFEGCINLKMIVLFPETPPTLGSDAIPVTISKIYVQQSSKEAYQAATNWTAFADKIESNNIYLSFVRFNKKNKEYIDGKAKESENYTDNNAGASLEFSIDNATFVLTATLKNSKGEILGTPQTVDLPLESVVVDGRYDNDSKSILLTLQNGNTVDIPVADLVDGLASASDIAELKSEKLDKPITPTSPSAVVITADGSVSTKALLDFQEKIYDEDDNKQYTYQIKIKNGFPVLVMTEITE